MSYITLIKERKLAVYKLLESDAGVECEELIGWQDFSSSTAGFKPVFVYMRVSTEDMGQDEENQRDDCLRFIRSKKLGDIVYIFSERESAWQKSAYRPVFEFMLKEAVMQKINIVTFAYDRIYRDRKKMVELVRNYKLLGIKILSVKQAWLETMLNMSPPFDEMMYEFCLQFIAWMAEDESNLKSSRVKSTYNRRRKAAEGKGEKVVWGRKAKTSSELVAEIEEILLVEKDLSIREITDRLNAKWEKLDVKVLVRGKPVRKKISKNIVHQILRDRPKICPENNDGFLEGVSLNTPACPEEVLFQDKLNDENPPYGGNQV
jgi:DNA invertase Pin-like site-specific DNA recombinase